MKQPPLIMFLLLLFIASRYSPEQLNAQEVVINEIVPSNTTFPDDFTNYPDWLEIYNAGPSAVDLSGMGLSDGPDAGASWKFNELILPPGGHLLVFASGKDISEMLSYNTIIDEGDSWKYMVPVQNLAPAWRMSGFDDTGWQEGPSGLGYGDGDDNTPLPSGTRSVYMRKSFEIDDVDNIVALLLHVDYDDAFVAYLNGVEVARANIGAVGLDPAFNAVPNEDHEALMYAGDPPDSFDVSFAQPFLQEGDNVLAIQAYNISATSSDFTIIPFLTIGGKELGSGTVPPYLPVPGSYLHTDFKLSAGGEAVYLFSANGATLDSVVFPALPDNLSYGRLQDGAPDLVVFEEPSPEQPNGGNYYIGINPDTIGFSHPSGLYQEPVTVSLSGSDSIRYTLDCTEPTALSALYEGSITLEESAILKAAIFDSNMLGRTYTRSYIITPGHSLPVFALTTEPDYLWDEDIGMYVYGTSYQNQLPYFGANFWEDWEYPFSLDYFDTSGTLVWHGEAGAKIFGAWSRAADQRSFSLFARKEYGTGRFDHEFFKERPYDEFESLVLRNSGNDWEYSMIRDAVMTSLMEGSHVDYQAYQPVATYLNGEYWGMYNLREKISEHFLASLHHVDPETIDLLEGDAEIKHGSNTDYIALRNFIDTHSMSDSDNYAYVMSQVDETSFIQYQVAEIYYNNTDWPGNNVRYWRSGEGKWRWILFDTDFGLGLFDPYGYNANTLDFATASNGPAWPNPPWSTLFLRRFLQNDQFKGEFINAFADAMNSVYLPSSATAHVDAIVSNISGEIQRHRQRWGQSISTWNSSVGRIKTFFAKRPEAMRTYIMNKFSLPAVWEINTLNSNVEGGSIRVNSLVIEISSWSGVYFEDNPIQLTAFPKPGYKFDHWSGDVDSDDPMIWINMKADMHVSAHFVKAQSPGLPVVINEINYHSAWGLDPGDWVELHNAGQEPVDISGWRLMDQDSTHSFDLPDSTLLPAGGFLVLCQDSVKFSTTYPDIHNFLGEIDFGFSSDGDAVRVLDASGNLADSLHYLPDLPWPYEANGLGPTLELISPELDNTKPESWHAFAGYGTPGKLNHYISGVGLESSPPSLHVYPNPSRGLLHVGQDHASATISWVRIYDLQGSLQLEYVPAPGTALLTLDVSHFQTGHYMLLATLSNGMTLSFLVQKI